MRRHSPYALRSPQSSRWNNEAGRPQSASSSESDGPLANGGYAYCIGAAGFSSLVPAHWAMRRKVHGLPSSCRTVSHSLSSRRSPLAGFNIRSTRWCTSGAQNSSRSAGGFPAVSWQRPSIARRSPFASTG
jgi:hypothetical protein